MEPMVVCYRADDPRSRRIDGTSIRSCRTCGCSVGVSPASLNAGTEYICMECFLATRRPESTEIVPPTAEQLRELCSHIRRGET